jgi:hypothetical protein
MDNSQPELIKDMNANLYILTIGMLLGGVLLTACQSDVPTEEPSDMGGICSDSCYINLQIVNTPIHKTRSSIAEENTIYDGILCIFEGISESTATLKTAVAIDQFINNPDNSTSVNITQRLAGTHSYNNKLYVLALLNTSPTGFTLSGNTLKFEGAALTGNTISQVRNLQIKSVGSIDKHVGLFMSNAPQSNYTMPEVTSTCLYDTESAAATGSRLVINVERAAAKVKVTNTASAVTSFCLDGDENRTATVHKITWVLHNYNTYSYAIRNGATAVQNWSTSITGTDIPIRFVNTGNDAFDLFQQQSYKEGDEVYIAENTTSNSNDQTQIFVEVQLKEGSFLLGDCYRYQLGSDAPIFFSSAARFIQFCKVGWKETFSRNFYNIKDKSADEVFKYYSISIHDNGNTTVTLTNNSFTTAEQTDLNNLGGVLSGLLSGYRNGKMYFTYKIRHSDNQNGVVRNNAYNLNFTTVPDIGDPVPTPIE